jgi:hypothetical protein
VICEVSEWTFDLPAELPAEDAVLLVDAKITQATGDPNGTFGQKVRIEDGVTMLDALFGRDKVMRTYLCREDPAMAKALAERELETLLED